MCVWFYWFIGRSKHYNAINFADKRSRQDLHCDGSRAAQSLEKGGTFLQTKDTLHLYRRWWWWWCGTGAGWLPSERQLFEIASPGQFRPNLTRSQSQNYASLKDICLIWNTQMYHICGVHKCTMSIFILVMALAHSLALVIWFTSHAQSCKKYKRRKKRKGKVQPNMKIQSLPAHGWLKLHSKIVLAHSPNKWRRWRPVLKHWNKT